MMSIDEAYPTVKHMVESEFFPEALFSRIKHEGHFEILAVNSVAPNLFVRYVDTKRIEVSPGNFREVKEDRYLRVYQVTKTRLTD